MHACAASQQNLLLTARVRSQSQPCHANVHGTYYQLPLLIIHDRSLELVWVAHTGHRARWRERETRRPSTRSLPNTSKLQPHGAITIRERRRQRRLRHRTPEAPEPPEKQQRQLSRLVPVCLTHSSEVCSGTNHAGLRYNMFWQPRPRAVPDPRGAVDTPRGEKL